MKGMTDFTLSFAQKARLTSWDYSCDIIILKSAAKSAVCKINES